MNAYAARLLSSSQILKTKLRNTRYSFPTKWKTQTSSLYTKRKDINECTTRPTPNSNLKSIQASRQFPFYPQIIYTQNPFFYLSLSTWERFKLQTTLTKKNRNSTVCCVISIRGTSAIMPTQNDPWCSNTRSLAIGPLFKKNEWCWWEPKRNPNSDKKSFKSPRVKLSLRICRNV